MQDRVKCKLFSCKCAHAYGSESWNLADRATNEYWSAYGRGARRLLGIPPSCPTVTIQAILGNNGAFNMVCKKSFRLINTFRLSMNDRMQFIYEVAMTDARSIIRKNSFIIEEAWGGHQPPRFVRDCSPITLGIIELLEVREGLRLLELDKDDIDSLMLLLCER